MTGKKNNDVNENKTYGHRRQNAIFLERINGNGLSLYLIKRHARRYCIIIINNDKRVREGTCIYIII